jgi:hypothetical protein
MGDGRGLPRRRISDVALVPRPSFSAVTPLAPRTCRVMSSTRIEVDPYGKEVRAHRPEGALAQLTPRIALPQLSHSLGRVVIVEDVRQSISPGGAGSRADSDMRIRPDVSDVIGAAPVLDDQPEGLAFLAITNGCSALSTGASPDRLQQRIARWPQSESLRKPDWRVHQELLDRLNDPILECRPGHIRHPSARTGETC